MSRTRTLAALFALIAGTAAFSADSRGAGPTEPGQRSPGATPVSTLAVTLDGPDYVLRNMICGWSALATGGTQPYTYSWTKTGAGVGSGYDQFWEGYIGYGASMMTLTVTVTDANNAQVTDTRTVLASSTAPVC